MYPRPPILVEKNNGRTQWSQQHTPTNEPPAINACAAVFWYRYQFASRNNKNNKIEILQHTFTLLIFSSGHRSTVLFLGSSTRVLTLVCVVHVYTPGSNRVISITCHAEEVHVNRGYTCTRNSEYLHVLEYALFLK